MVRGSCRCCENCEIFQGKKLSICIAEPASGILWDAEILHKMAALVKSTLEPIAKFDIDFRYSVDKCRSPQGDLLFINTHVTYMNRKHFRMGKM